MTIATDITDLLTPLGAYLRLRGEGSGGVPARVGRREELGRCNLVGSGSRLVSFAEAETAVAAGSPVVGYLGYDHVALLEPTVPLPADGPGFPESRFVVADTLVRFDRVANVAEVIAGERDPIERVFRSDMARVEPQHRSGMARSTRRFPAQERPGGNAPGEKEHIRAGDAYQIVLSQRAER